MMQMADDKSEVSGMMQMADDVSDANLVNDLGRATKAPVIQQKASDDDAVTKVFGSAGNDFVTAKQKARRFNALSVMNTKRPQIAFGQGSNAFGNASDGEGSQSDGQMQMDNESEASGMM